MCYLLLNLTDKVQWCFRYYRFTLPLVFSYLCSFHHLVFFSVVERWAGVQKREKGEGEPSVYTECNTTNLIPVPYTFYVFIILQSRVYSPVKYNTIEYACWFHHSFHSFMILSPYREPKNEQIPNWNNNGMSWVWIGMDHTKRNSRRLRKVP